MKKLGWVARGKYVNPDKIPFQQLLPFKLKTCVSGKGEKSMAAACVQEMSRLFSCLKDHNFNEVACSKEVLSFKKCWTEHAAHHRAQKAYQKQGVLVSGEKKLSHMQVGELLKQYPK